MVFVSKPDTIPDQAFLAQLREALTEGDDNVEYREPCCNSCKAELKPGDVLDHFWPFYSDKNLCATCAEKG